MNFVNRVASRQARCSALRTSHAPNALRTLSALTRWIVKCGLASVLALLAAPLCAQTAIPSAGQSAARSRGDSLPAAQKASAGQAAIVAAPVTAAADQSASSSAAPPARDRRRAHKLYVAASKLFLDRKFDEAMNEFAQAAKLDPANADYRLAAGVARGHLVTALVQEAAKDRLLGNEAASRTALERARALDPTNIEVSQHLDELGDDAARSEPPELYAQSGSRLAGPPQLEPMPGQHNFHLHNDLKQIVQQVFKAYGITPMIDNGVHSSYMRFDVDDMDFEQATRALGLATNTFFVPVDAHRALVAENTFQSRTEFLPQDTETVYLNGMTDDDMNEVLSVAKNVFAMTHASVSPSSHALLLRAPERTLDAFNTTLQSLIDGRSQVVLDVRMIQVAHTGSRNTGAQLPQSMSAFNVFAEEQSLLSQNAAAVQQIISSGLASANDPLAILGILIASGQISSPLLSSGFALFGGGITQSALELGTFNFNLSLNTSDSRELDEIQLRLQDGEKGTLKLGEKYPIQTASYSSVGPNLSKLAGLGSAGTSSSLSSLLSQFAGASTPTVPQVQYQDLGLTLTVTPKALRNNDIALTVDMKLDALAGTFVDNNPVLDNRAYSGVVTLKEGEATVVATEMDKSQSQAISGTPGLSEIPGLNNVTDKDRQQNYATLVIVMTPHVVRSPQSAGHSPIMMVDKSGGR